MNSASYRIARAFTSIAVTLALLWSLPGAAEPEGGQVVGFEDTQGKVLFLHDFKGHPVLINLWATWCAPCIKEMPSLAKLQQDYASTGLTVIALSEDDNLSDATKFFREHGIAGLPVYFDKGHGVMAALKARGMPTSVLVTRGGDMVQRIEGPVDWQSAAVLKIVGTILKK